MTRNSSRRSGLVRSRRIAAQGTGTWAIINIMNTYLLANPGDVDEAARVAQNKGRNLGLALPVWDEHGDETCKMLYNRYIQPYEQTPREVPQDIRDRYPNPHATPTPEPEPEREGEEPTGFVPPEPTLRPPEIVMGAAAMKYYLATEGGKPSQQREIGLWSHEDILAKVGFFESIISGNTRSLEAWGKLADMVPSGCIVKDFVTNEQLEELGLKP